MTSEGTNKRKFARTGSLRLRMMLGAGLIALLALLAAAAMIYGAATVAQRIAEATAAERRSELYGTLSARISDYAVVAIEAASAVDIPEDQRVGRLVSRHDLVDAAFDDIETALAEFVAGSRDETESNRRAVRSLGIARMRARFRVLSSQLEAPANAADEGRLRVQLDSFATQFSPLLDAAIGRERRDRVLAFAAIDDLRRRITLIALGIGGAAVLAFIIFQAGLISPLLRRVDATAVAARMIGGGRLNTRLEIDQRDELGLLFANVNRMAARLDRRGRDVDADRAQLNQIIEERTVALRDANSELERIDRNRRRFFSDVSHELRTPLTVILGETEIAMRAKSLPDQDAQAAFQVIHARARRLNRRVDDLLRIARSEAGQIELHDRPFDVGDALAEAVEDVAGLARRRSIEITYKANGTLLTLGDLDWSRQVICGVLENALRYSETEARIEAEAYAHDGEIILHITDEGSGIASDDLERVFERFERGHRSVESLGFGVGLALARWVMERQSGTISLKSPPPDPLAGPVKGLGTQVTLRFPQLA